MKKTVCAGLMAAVAALCCGQNATAGEWTAEAQFASVHDVEGGEFGLGYSFTAGNFRLTPLVGGFVYQGDNDRYRRETLSNGNEICRDMTNGRFSDKENCDDTAVKAYGKVEVAYRFGTFGDLGAGVRVGDETDPYVTASKFLGSRAALKVNVGSDYTAGGISINF